MASRLEAATKQYGVPLLMSGELTALLSPAARARTRAVDCVTVKGSATPVVLYTSDADPTRAPGMGEGPVGPAGGPGGGSFSAGPFDSEFNQHPDLAPTWAVDEAFIATWDAGYRAYRAGDWAAAKSALAAAAARRGGAGDGPAAALLAFMDKSGGAPPRGWRGFRELTEK